MATSLQAQCADFDEPNPHTIQEEAPREHEHHLDELRRPHQIREEEDEVHKAELEQAQERPAVLVVREEAELGMCSTGEDQEDAAQEPSLLATVCNRGQRTESATGDTEDRIRADTMTDTTRQHAFELTQT